MIIRFERNRKKKYGWVVGDRVRVIEGDVFKKEELTVMTGLEIPYSGLQFELPCEPSKMVVAQKSGSHPLKGLRDIAAVEVPLDHVVAPNQTFSFLFSNKDLFYGIGMAIVFKNSMKAKQADQMEEHIIGITCMLSIQSSDGHTLMVTIGPGILPRLHGEAGEICLKVNQKEQTRVALGNVLKESKDVLVKTAQRFTFEPGDILGLGVIRTEQRVQSGDHVEVFYDKMPYPLTTQIEADR